jgi:hypothetical protein
MIKTKTKCLISVQGSISFIAAYIAYRWCEEKIWCNNSDVTLLIYDTCVPEENEIPFKNSLEEIASIAVFHKIIYVSSSESNMISKRRYSEAKEKLRKIIGEESFDYLFLCNNFVTFLTELIPNVYPKSIKVEYGDFFGIVGNNSVLEITYLDLLIHPIGFLKGYLKKQFYGHYHKSFPFDLAVLSMPLVGEANYLYNKILIVPDKLFVKDIFFKFSVKLYRLSNYCESLLGNSERECKLYLLSNFFNSGLCTLENEVNLYEEIILQTAFPGDRIILKNHPRGSNIVLIQLKLKLEVVFDVQIITDNHFNFIPIELWLDLLNRSQVFPIYSSSGISLKYLCSKQVTLTLNCERINKYIFFHKRQIVLQGNEMINVAINTLEYWDGKTPLWTKKGKNS